MKPVAYYNEIDPHAAEWLRNLIKAGHIAPGVVDERSIEDVVPADLKDFTQCHFFAGIGVWSLALRRANWADDVRVWTGSCPCQPFSAAGAGAGFADERHLWPAFHHLIAQCRPPVVFGEQVASKAVEPWIDLVHADLEALGYAFGGVPFPSAGVGAPHIRDRLYWVGHSNVEGLEGYAGHGGAAGRGGSSGSTAAPSVPVRLANSDSLRLVTPSEPELHHSECDAESRSGFVGLGNTDGQSAGRNAGTTHAEKIEHGSDGCDGDGFGNAGGLFPEPEEQSAAGPTNGFWRAADWLLCRDGKWRPVRPGASPLVDGAASRVVCVCPDCKTETVIYEGVHSLRSVPVGHQGRGAEEVLRQGMLQAASFVETAYKQKRWAFQGEGCREEQGMQSLREPCAPGSTPSGQECSQRQPVQSGEALLNVSRPGAPQRSTFIDMRSVWDELRRSLASEPQQDLLCPLCKRVGPQECGEEMGGSRAGRLKGYGNAINAKAAQVFIESFMDGVTA